MTNIAIEKRSLIACYPPKAVDLRFLEADFIYCEDERISGHNFEINCGSS